MSDLKGKTYLVTGASSGLGFSVCQAIDRSGGSFVGIGRDQKRLAKLMKSIKNSGHQTLQFDLCKCNQFGKLVSKLDSINGIVHCAGDVKDVPIRQTSLELIESIFTINSFSPILLTSEILKAKKLASQGSVVFISTIATIRPQKTQLAYAMSKAGLTVAAKCFSNEFSKKNKHRFNNLVLGLVDTPVLLHIKKYLGSNAVEELNEKYPLGIGKSSDISSAVLFLLSDSARWITGSTIVIDGGRVSSI